MLYVNSRNLSGELLLQVNEGFKHEPQLFHDSNRCHDLLYAHILRSHGAVQLYEELALVYHGLSKNAMFHEQLKV